MPLYVYRCTSCDQVFEELVSASEAREGAAVPCPECGEKKTERELTTFAVRGDARQPSDAPLCNRCGEDRPPCRA